MRKSFCWRIPKSARFLLHTYYYWWHSLSRFYFCYHSWFYSSFHFLTLNPWHIQSLPLSHSLNLQVIPSFCFTELRATVSLYDNKAKTYHLRPKKPKQSAIHSTQFLIEWRSFSFGPPRRRWQILRCLVMIKKNKMQIALFSNFSRNKNCLVKSYFDTVQGTKAFENKTPI